MDVSRGTPGVLPQLSHPENGAQVTGFYERFNRKTVEWSLELAAAGERITDMSLEIEARPKTSSEVRAGYLDFLMTTLGNEPAVKALAYAEEKAFHELKEAASRIAQRNLRRSIGASSKAWEEFSNQAVAAMHAFAQGFDTALRRRHRLEHRYTTGLAAHFGDPDWHQRAVLKIGSATLATWNWLHVNLAQAYLACLVTRFHPEQGADAEDPEHAEVAKCPEALRDSGIKLTFESPAPVGPNIKLGIKMTCGMTTVEAAFFPWKIKSNPIFEATTGPFVQLDLPNGGGDITVFAGGNGKAGVAGNGGSGKAGVYVTANPRTGEIKDMGLKATLEATGKLSSVTFSQKVGESKFSFVPSLPMPARGPTLRAQ